MCVIRSTIAQLSSITVITVVHAPEKLKILDLFFLTIDMLDCCRDLMRAADVTRGTCPSVDSEHPSAVLF